MSVPQAPWWGIPWPLWALAAAAIAAVYAVVDHRPVASLTDVVARWGHVACWVLLSVSFLLRMTPAAGLANPVALAGGLCYLAYLVVR